MLSPKRFLQIFFLTITLLIVAAVADTYRFTKKYPPPFTNRISLDAKLQFVRDKIDVNKIDTFIVGSSIGLNNVIGSILEKESKKVKHAINFSVYEATTLEAEQLTKLTKTFPNLKRIIYSAQYSDLPHTWKYKNFDAKKYIKFMNHTLSPLEVQKMYFDACNNIIFCHEREKKWEKEHMHADQFPSLIFDHTGSVPLKIYRQRGVGGRWYLPHPPIMHEESFRAIERMAKEAQERGLHFYVAHQPYRPELYKKHKSVRDGIAYFDKKVTQAIKEYNGTLIKLQNLPLNNSHFADRSHLNDRGSAIGTKAIAEAIDKTEKEQ
jgi:hypothetical protein